MQCTRRDRQTDTRQQARSDIETHTRHPLTLVTSLTSAVYSNSEEIIFGDSRINHKLDIPKRNSCTCAKYYTSSHHIHQWPLSHTSRSTCNHLKRSGFICSKIPRAHGLRETAIPAVFCSVTLYHILYIPSTDRCFLLSLYLVFKLRLYLCVLFYMHVLLTMWHVSGVSRPLSR